MKYEKGAKFIIEIESRLANEQVGLYKVKGFKTLVFDDNGLDRLERIHEHDGCDGCKYEYMPYGNVEPCKSCCYNYTPKFEPKPEEIQVGDEVEHNKGEKKGIVICKEYDEDNGRVWLRVLTNQKAKYHFWSETLCHRTGKSYPELVKALEQLPKDGE